MFQEITITPATIADRSEIVALLQSQKLPTEDLPSPLENFIVVKENGKVIGSVGIQLYGKYALLRSLAVDSAHQGNGLGKALYKAAIELASNKKVQELFLITTTADPFFKKLGFLQIDRKAVPAPIQASAQFSSICPASSTVMSKKL